MTKLDKKQFSSKILLFGEYTVIHGGDSLAMPFDKYSATWSFDVDDSMHKDDLYRFYQFFENHNSIFLDLQSWKEDLEKGLFIKSSIPIGYGVGSSGSVVAAVYDRYAIKKHTDLQKLKEVFSFMESYFHGTSSGLDPLVAYTNESILSKNKQILTQRTEDFSLLDHLFIWDSKHSRSTAPLVKWYKNQLLKNDFSSFVSDGLIPANNSLIQSFLDVQLESFDMAFREVCRLQQEYLSPFFPDNLMINMENDFPDLDYYVKLCGAGGGGFYLIYVPEVGVLEDCSHGLISLLPKDSM